MENKKVKNILFKVELVGKGVVNYDSNDQKRLWNANTEGTGQERVNYDNVSFAKKRWYLNKVNNNYDHKLIISSNCLRHHIFIDDVCFQSPNVINNEYLLLSMIASPASLLRGYLFAANKEFPIKRSSSLNITDAEQITGSLSSIEIFNRSGEKTNDPNKSDTTLFKKETVGNISYEAVGNIDLMQMQFISCDQIFDRLAFNVDLFGNYLELLKKRLPSFNSKLGYYQIKNSIIEIPEYGFILSNEDIVELTKELLKRIYKLSIKKANAYAEVSKVKIKYVYDVFDNKINDDNGWIDLDSDTITNLNFESEYFYIEKEISEAKILRKKLEEEAIERKKRNEEKKKNKKNSTDNVSVTDDNN